MDGLVCKSTGDDLERPIAADDLGICSPQYIQGDLCVEESNLEDTDTADHSICHIRYNRHMAQSWSTELERHVGIPRRTYSKAGIALSVEAVVLTKDDSTASRLSREEGWMLFGV